MGFRHIRLLALSAVGSLAAVAGQAGTIPTATFDWNPHALGLNGAKFTADTVKLADYGQIVVDPVTGGFTEAGYLQVLGFALNGQNIITGSFNAPYGWGAYVSYQATGTQAVTSSGILATYSSLSYSLYGFNNGSVIATYGLDPTTGAAYESGGTNLTLLGSGNLIDGSITLIPTVFEGGTPVQFAANGEIQATISNVPHQFSSNTFLGFDVNVVHPPGELFPISPTTFEADGGSSSTATLIASRGNSGRVQSSAFVTAVPEPASAPLLAVGLVPIGVMHRRRRLRSRASGQHVTNAATSRAWPLRASNRERDERATVSQPDWAGPGAPRHSPPDLSHSSPETEASSSLTFAITCVGMGSHSSHMMARTSSGGSAGSGLGA